MRLGWLGSFLTGWLGWLEAAWPDALRHTARRRHATRLTFAALCTAVGTLACVSPASALSDYTWSGAGPAASLGHWSDPANWAGDAAPSGTVGTLRFPALASASCTTATPAPCYTSRNDLSGISANAISIDDSVPYRMTGDRINLGAGGIVASPSGSGSATGIDLPITVTNPQTWLIPGTAGGSLSLFADVDDAPMHPQAGGDRLTIDLRDGGELRLGARMDVGPIIVSAASDPSGAPGLFDLGLAGSPASLNGASGYPVSFDRADLNVAGRDEVGNLTMKRAQLLVGQASAPALLTAVGGVSLDSASSVSFTVERAGTRAGTDYSQIRSTPGFSQPLPPINLGGAKLVLQGRHAACPRLHVGDVDTLVSSRGTIKGSFRNAPNHSIVTVGCDGGAGTPPAARINYSRHAVTVTVIAAGRLLVTSDRLRVSRDSVSIPLQCASRVSCISQLTITTRETIRSPGSKKTVNVACAQQLARLRAGERKTIRAPLSTTCIVALARAHAHRLKSRLTSTPRTGQPSAARTVTLYL